MIENSIPIPLQVVAVSPSISNVQKHANTSNNILPSKEMLSFQKLNKCQRKASLCCSRIKNPETNKYNYCNLLFGLIFIVVITVIDSYIWNTSNDNPNNLKTLSTKAPIQLLMTIAYEIFLDVSVIYIALFLSFISVYFTTWFGIHYPSKYYDDELLSNISKTEKCFYFLSIIQSVLAEIGGILIIGKQLLLKPTFANAIFVLFRVFALHSALAITFIKYQVLLYGPVSIKKLLKRLSEPPTTQILSDNYAIYKIHYSVYRNMYKPLELIVSFTCIRLVSGLWLSVGDILAVNISSGTAAAVIYQITELIFFTYFLCEHTKQFHKLQNRLSNIVLEITEKKLGTECYVECAGFEKLLKTRKYNGRVFGYEFSYKGLVISLMYFAVVRFVAYSIEKQNL
eukprot:347950_1